ncbi:unnamed protein product [Parascedosporium putredinis]|uniref:Uncharacterized protein n=1 Tax=Parascedosporium putredinis TaxID=1442378 RepID=A0A9P1GY20_9PEZI|nr:unnamed protein product [Parascedosporium putredinis]CAI7990323.1 unnamed protein product [Parascedosporium putredinis]
MFEAFSQQSSGHTGNQSHDWHHTGELALFTARTPEAHIDGDAHHIFCDERVDMALSAVLRRRQLVLSTPEWKSVPWQRIPKNLKDILVDVLVDMPRLVEDFDNMQQCTEESKKETLRLALIQKCWEHDGQLSAWFGLLRQVANASNTSRPESRAKDVVTYVAQVHGMSLFWATSLILYSILWMASGPQADLPNRTDPMQHAHRLVQAVAILLQPNAGLYGQQSAWLLLEVCRHFVTAGITSTHESEMLLETLERLKDGLGNGLTRMLNTNLVDQNVAIEVTST